MITARHGTVTSNLQLRKGEDLTLINLDMNFLWNSVRKRSFTNWPWGLSGVVAWFLKIRSTNLLVHKSQPVSAGLHAPSSQRRFTENVPGTFVLRPGASCPRAAARFNKGFFVAISASRAAADAADSVCSCLAFSSARSRLIFSSSRRSSAVSSSSSSESESESSLQA